MSFKEMLLDDLDRVFFNLGEFADELTLDGEKVIGVLDMAEHLSEHAIFTVHSRNMQYKSESLQTGDRVLFIQESYLAVRPRIGDKLNINGDYFSVLDITEERGLYQIHLRDTSW